MYLGIKQVKPLPNYLLLLTFENGEERYFDVTPLLGTGVFSSLRDQSLFETVFVKYDTIEWPNGVDLDPEILYSESTTRKPQYIA